MLHLSEKDYVITDWSGGKTIQLAISPAGADYADRDFLWRVSSATVTLDESDFTPLPDYMRYITPLTGEMTLTHNGGEKTSLEPMQVRYFDGADDTHSWGKCTDFNLMLRKGKRAGDMRRIVIGRGESVTLEAEHASEEIVLYCVSGRVRISGEGESAVDADRGEGLYAVLKKGQTLTLASEDGAALMGAFIWEI